MICLHSIITILFIPILFHGLLCGGAMAQNSALRAGPRNDDWWKSRHQSMNDQVRKGSVDLIFIGDSITQGWEGHGKAVWHTYYGSCKAVNLGISGDKTS